MASSAAAVSRTLIGEPLRSDRLDETLLPKRLALPVFCSDPLSSVAYATEQIVLVLGLGGLALLHLTPWLGAAVVVLLVIVVASYRQTCAAYPNGGGAYAVSRANLVVASRPITTSVVAALRLFGGWNDGTPLETASTPVSAVQPDANARRTRKTVSRPPVSAVSRSA